MGWLGRLGLVLLALLWGCAPESQSTVIVGQAMGTTWQVTIAGTSIDAVAVESGLGDLLEEMEDQFSHWRENSEVSRFNRAPANEAVPVSREVAWLVARAEEIRGATDGAFDVRVAGEVARRGFGPEGLVKAVAEGAIEVSQDPPTLTKREPGLAIDLSAIAKGYAVDRMGAWLDGERHEHYLIELGGELKGRGRNATGVPWVVGIEAPDPAQRVVQARVALQNAAIATSGDYRLVRSDEDGGAVSHLVDPRGDSRPMDGAGHRSVSVIHPEGATADAWATALYVLDEEEGIRIAEEQELAACFLRRDPSGAVVMRATAAFERQTAR